MVGIQRFVTYIYAYEDGQKGSNAGYAKLEIRGNTGRMEIHLSGTGVIKGMGSICFLKGWEGKFWCIPVGEFTIENGSGIYQTNFMATNILNKEVEFEHLDGIYIKDSHEKIYLSFWKDVGQVAFLPENFVDEESLAQETASEDMMSENLEKSEKIEVIETIETSEMPAHSVTIEEREQELLHTTEVPVHNVFPKPNLDEIWENLQKSHLSVQINKNVEAIQIELRDLRELPKSFWYLGNNSFLLHGFFNYHYLLFGKLPDGSWFLGVPGVYQKQERVMASVFGFPGFLSAETGDVAVAETGECGQMQQISARELQPGAWYHVLED